MRTKPDAEFRLFSVNLEVKKRLVTATLKAHINYKNLQTLTQIY